MSPLNNFLKVIKILKKNNEFSPILVTCDRNFKVELNVVSNVFRRAEHEKEK